MWLAYLILDKSPTRWWLWLGLVSLPLIAGTALLRPILFEPIFNDFEPLKDKTLEARILDLAARADIPGRKVFEVDKSAQTKKYNAYVSGFGASQRIVLWDTTLQGLEQDEILFVMGHEMGHYVLGHVWKGILISSAISLGLFFAAGGLSSWALRRFGPRWGFTRLADIASMPLLLATINVVSFVIQGPIYAYTRGIENEADVYGLEITRDNDAAARAFLKLGAQNKSNPEPSRIVEVLLYSHPPDGRRLRLALDYKPWESGKPNRYFKAKP
jgi:Zn-dependent protease with chaperone function